MRVFVNSSPLDVPAGSNALDAVTMFDAAAAAEVGSGQRTITDSRGLPLDPATVMGAGSILRVVAVRDRAPTDTP